MSSVPVVMAFDAVPGIPADMTYMMSIINKKLSDQHNEHVQAVETYYEAYYEELTSKIETMDRGTIEARWRQTLDHINTELLKVDPDAVVQVAMDRLLADSDAMLAGMGIPKLPSVDSAIGDNVRRVQDQVHLSSPAEQPQRSKCRRVI